MCLRIHLFTEADYKNKVSDRLRSGPESNIFPAGLELQDARSVNISTLCQNCDHACWAEACPVKSYFTRSGFGIIISYQNCFTAFALVGVKWISEGLQLHGLYTNNDIVLIVPLVTWTKRHIYKKAQKLILQSPIQTTPFCHTTAALQLQRRHTRKSYVSTICLYCLSEYATPAGVSGWLIQVK